MSRFSLRREIAFGLGVYALYLAVGRLVMRRDGRMRARANAERIVALEERLGVDVEPVVQRALLRFPRLVHGLNVGYGLLNVTLTVGWLVFLYRRRDDGYHRFRLDMPPRARCRAAGLPCAADGSTACPRRLRRHHFRGERARPRHPLLVRFYNSVAAMPSLHVAFAVVTGAELADRTDSRTLQVAAHAYAPLVATLVAGTGNHYVLDAVAGAALGAAARRSS